MPGSLCGALYGSGCFDDFSMPRIPFRCGVALYEPCTRPTFSRFSLVRALYVFFIYHHYYFDLLFLLKCFGDRWGWGGAAAARCRGAEGGGAAVHHINFSLSLAVHIAVPDIKFNKNH